MVPRDVVRDERERRPGGVAGDARGRLALLLDPRLVVDRGNDPHLEGHLRMVEPAELRTLRGERAELRRREREGTGSSGYRISLEEQIGDEEGVDHVA